MNELRLLSQAVSASLTFAGEHTSPVWAATVHGAYQSGQRAADDMLNGVPTPISTAYACKHAVAADLFILFVLLVSSAF